MGNNNLRSIFLALVRVGIGHSMSLPITDVDLPVVKTISEKQGLLAVVLDGLEGVQHKGFQINSLQDKILLAQWIGEVSQFYEQRYEQNLHAISDLAAFYNNHGLKMMVLKGFACSLNWPKAAHRPIGDIDIWQFGQHHQADAALTNEGIKIDSSHHHHTVFIWRDFMVENHFDFINVHHHKSNRVLEKELKRLGEDDTQFVEVYGEKVYLPSPNLHALFLLKHTMNDFSSFSMTLRQLLDWAFHVQRYNKEIDWNWLLSIMEKFHMREFFNCINAICVEDLGFDVNIFPYIQFNPEIKGRVLDDILYPKYSVREPYSLLPRLMYKYYRWKANEWKHKLCYEESMCSAFWSGVWSHLLKPSSI